MSGVTSFNNKYLTEVAVILRALGRILKRRGANTEKSQQTVSSPPSTNERYKIASCDQAWTHFQGLPPNMDPEFTAYLIEKGIDVNEFKAATIGEKGTILTAFTVESSKKGNLFR